MTSDDKPVISEIEKYSDHQLDMILERTKDRGDTHIIAAINAEKQRRKYLGGDPDEWFDAGEY